MKVLIDIPKEEYKNCKSINWSNIRPEQVDEWDYIISHGTPIPDNATILSVTEFADKCRECGKNYVKIPDNATNGDVAELVWGFKPRENTCIIPKTECNGNPAECDGCRFDDWWKEPYQKGGK